MRFLTILFAAAFALSAAAQSYDELCDSGKALCDEGNYREAAARFARAADVARDRNNRIFALSGEGYAHYMAGDIRNASESYAQALALDSTSVHLLAQRGNILLEQDSLQGAIACYDKAAEREPDNRDILFCRAYARACAGLYKESKQDYLKILSKNSNDEKARLGLALLYQKEGSTNESLMLLETLIEENPRNAELYMARCNIEREQKQYELALMDVEKAIEQEPLNAAFHLTKADILEKLGKRDAAQKSRNKALRIKSTPKGK